MFPASWCVNQRGTGSEGQAGTADGPRAARNRRLGCGRWWELAACSSADPELFFPVSEVGPARGQVARAKAVCADCGVRQQCLDYALTTRQLHGVWGGLTEEERQAQSAQRDRQLSRLSRAS
jgi:WhiB family redox-sensing transcriptional regulator